MNDSSISKGNRILVGAYTGGNVQHRRGYGTVTFVGPNGTIWYQPDDGGAQVCVRPQYGEPVERVHGNKHRARMEAE